MTPKWCSCLFFLAIQCPRQHVTAKSGIPDQTDGIYTLFQTKMANSIPYFRLEMIENDTLWGGTYLYGLAYGILPPPPLPGGGGDPLGPFPLMGMDEPLEAERKTYHDQRTFAHAVTFSDFFCSTPADTAWAWHIASRWTRTQSTSTVTCNQSAAVVRVLGGRWSWRSTARRFEFLLCY